MSDQGPFKGVAQVYMIRRCGALLETLKRRGELMERYRMLHHHLHTATGVAGGTPLAPSFSTRARAVSELQATGHRLRACEEKVRWMCVGGGETEGSALMTEGKALIKATEGKALMGTAQDVVGALVIFNSRFARDDCLRHCSLSTPDKACLDGVRDHAHHHVWMVFAIMHTTSAAHMCGEPHTTSSVAQEYLNDALSFMT